MFNGWRMVRPIRYWTVKQWKKVKKVHEKHVGDKIYYLDMQEVLCKKYDIILVDHKTSKEKIVGVLKAINFKNFDKGMLIFDGAMKEFDNAMKDFGKELGENKISQEKISGKKPIHGTNKINLFGSGKKSKSNTMDIWGTKRKSKTKSIKIWSSQEPKKRKKYRKKSKAKVVNNMTKIWGNKK